jgi:hypothetical protein
MNCLPIPTMKWFIFAVPRTFALTSSYRLQGFPQFEHEGFRPMARAAHKPLETVRAGTVVCGTLNIDIGFCSDWGQTQANLSWLNRCPAYLSRVVV